MLPEKKIGFIGLGDMGKPMCKNLVKKGFPVTVYGRREGPVNELVTIGARAVKSPRELGESCDVILSLVRDSMETDEVILGKNGVGESLKNGAIVITGSTLDPGYCQRLDRTLQQKRAHLLDAPVSGGRVRAEAGAISFMVGGEKPLFEECLPIFQAMGEKIFYMGGSGMGQAMKLVNQLTLIVTMAGASQAIGVGLKAGIELDRILEVLKVSTGDSFVVRHWDLYVSFIKEFEQKQGTTMNLVRKDVNLAVKFANEIGEFVPVAGLVSQLDFADWFPDKPRAAK